MRIVLLLAAFTVSASAIAEGEPRNVKPSRVPMLCTKSGQQLSGLTKTCYYGCPKSEGAMTIRAYETCPRWTLRWRLNRNSQFGPIRNSRN
jgi:hypothetical protein